MGTKIPLLSASFLALAGAGVFATAALRGGARQFVFLATNLTLLLVVFLGPRATISTLVFVLLGWAVLVLTQRFPTWGAQAGIAGVVLLFVWMRDYAFLGWVLPEALRSPALATMGLSFLLFKLLHVLMEARSGTLGPVSFPAYVNYCLNFTTFAMGPIQRFQDYRGQWGGDRVALAPTAEAHLNAVNRILFGLFRVYVLAALLEPHMMKYGAGTESAPPAVMLLQVYAFYFYLYFNFAGYCDIVIGLGSLMGIRPPENFDKPFLARNVSEFWQRQHRTLTLWLTDYVFTPSLKRALSGRLRGHRHLAVAAALTLTMLISGLWHGTTAGFLLFGMAHAAFLVIYHLWDSMLLARLGRKRLAALRRQPIAIALAMAITFHATAFAFVFFQLGARRGLELFTNLIL